MRRKQFNKEYEEVSRKSRVKLHKSGKNWVTTVVSSLGLFRVSGADQVTAEVKTVKLGMPSSLSSSRLLKGAVAASVIFGGMAFAQLTHADDTLATETMATSDQTADASSVTAVASDSQALASAEDQAVVNVEEQASQSATTSQEASETAQSPSVVVSSQSTASSEVSDQPVQASETAQAGQAASVAQGTTTIDTPDGTLTYSTARAPKSIEEAGGEITQERGVGQSISNTGKIIASARVTAFETALTNMQQQGFATKEQADAVLAAYRAGILDSDEVSQVIAMFGGNEAAVISPFMNLVTIQTQEGQSGTIIPETWNTTSPKIGDISYTTEKLADGNYLIRYSVALQNLSGKWLTYRLGVDSDSSFGGDASLTANPSFGNVPVTNYASRLSGDNGGNYWIGNQNTPSYTAGSELDSTGISKWIWGKKYDLANANETLEIRVVTSNPASSRLSISIGISDNQTTADDVANGKAGSTSNKDYTAIEIKNIDQTAKTDAETYEPTGQPVNTDLNSTPNASDAISNKDDMPEGTSYDWQTTPDTSSEGTKPSTVVVTYPDGTTHTVDVDVVVTDNRDDATKYEPTGQTVNTDLNGTPNASDAISNKDDMPEGTSYDWQTSPDTSTEGTKPSTVVVTYPDGTKDTVDVDVVVTDNRDDATKYEPEVTPEEVIKGNTPDLTDNISNLPSLPEGTSVKDVTPAGDIDVNTPGDYQGTVEVTYPDGSKDTVKVPVVVKDDQAGQNDPKGQDVTVETGQTPNAEDGISNIGDLPEGTVVDWKDPIDTTSPGEKDGTIIVTYPDGSVDEVPVKVIVNEPAQSEQSSEAASDSESQASSEAPAQSDTTSEASSEAPAESEQSSEAASEAPAQSEETSEAASEAPVQSEETSETPAQSDTTSEAGSEASSDTTSEASSEAPAESEQSSEAPAESEQSSEAASEAPAQSEETSEAASEAPAESEQSSEATSETPAQSEETSEAASEAPAESEQASEATSEAPAESEETSESPVQSEQTSEAPATSEGVSDSESQASSETDSTSEAPAQSDTSSEAGSEASSETTSEAGSEASSDTTSEASSEATSEAPAQSEETSETPTESEQTSESPVQSEQSSEAASEAPADSEQTSESPAQSEQTSEAASETPAQSESAASSESQASSESESASHSETPSQADQNDPKGQDVTVETGQTPNAEDGIANLVDLPEGTVIDWKDPIDTTTPGEKDGTIIVTYPDGSTDQVPVKVNVKEPVAQIGQVVVRFVDDQGNVIAPSQFLNGQVGQAYTTTAPVINGYLLVETPSNAKGTFASSSQDVTYVYKKLGSFQPVIPGRDGEAIPYPNDPNDPTKILEPSNANYPTVPYIDGYIPLDPVTKQPLQAVDPNNLRKGYYAPTPRSPYSTTSIEYVPANPSDPGRPNNPGTPSSGSDKGKGTKTQSADVKASGISAKEDPKSTKDKKDADKDADDQAQDQDQELPETGDQSSAQLALAGLASVATAALGLMGLKKKDQTQD